MCVLKQVRAGLVDQPVRMFVLAMFVVSFRLLLRSSLLLLWVRSGRVVQRNFDQLSVASGGSELVDFYLVTHPDV